MKIRNIPFGYCYENGRKVFEPMESEIIKELFNEYRNGKSLQQLSQELNARGIEYLPKVVAWNKSRVRRLLEDRRYIGEEGYPVLIERDLFDEIQDMKTQKYEQKDLDRKADIFQMRIPVRCPRCNHRMQRVVDNRAKNPIRWVCKTRGCGFSKNKLDESLFEELTTLLNVAILNPEKIEIPVGRKTEIGTELRMLNNEISRAFESTAIDGEEVRKKMLMCTMLRYAEVDSAVSKAQRLKDIFTASLPLKEFSLTFLEKTVDEIKFHEDGTMGIVLENGQEIIEEVGYANCCT